MKRPEIAAPSATFLDAGPSSVKLQDMKASFLAASILVLAGCGDRSAPQKTGASSGNPVTAPVDYLEAVNKGKKASIKVADLASVKQAIQMFYAEEERYPKDLNELISKQIIPRLPDPPYQMKYTYNPANGEVKIVPAQ
jgi:hypothetical protein